MRALIISESYPSVKRPHSGSFVAKLASGLAARGHEIMVISPRGLSSNLGAQDQVADGIWATFPVVPTAFRSSKHRALLELEIRIAAHLCHMRLRKHGFVPDIIYAHFAFASGAIASRLSMAIGVNYVLSLGESTLEQTLRNEGPIRTPILDAMHGAAAIACVSRGLLAAASRFVPEANSYYVPNGVDLDIFSKQPRDQARAKLGIRTKEPVFGFVGSLTERKGAPVLKFLSDQLGAKFNLMVATGGQQIDLPTLRCGFVPNRELATFLSACDFFLFPTVAEGMSNALLEAMACEVPIITSDTAFNREFLNHENAILTDFSDREGLMRIVESAIANPLQFEPLAQKAIQDVKHYSLEKRVDRIERILVEQHKPL